jgi:hypothetical protein
MIRFIFLLILFLFNLSCKVFKAGNQEIKKTKPYCFQEMDSAQYLRFYGINPRLGTSDDWGSFTENGEIIGEDCIHRADSIILCNRHYGLNKKCDTIQRPDYKERMNLK